jgi:hypothetical protein
MVYTFKLDFYVENINVERLDIKRGLSHVISFTAVDNKIR